MLKYNQFPPLHNTYHFPVPSNSPPQFIPIYHSIIPSSGSLPPPPLTSPKNHKITFIIGVTFTLIAVICLGIYLKTSIPIFLVILVGATLVAGCNGITMCCCFEFNMTNKIMRNITMIVSLLMFILAASGGLDNIADLIAHPV